MPSVIEWFRALQMPIVGSDYAQKVDDAYMLIWWVNMAFFAMIAIAVIYFVMKFRRRRADEQTPHLSHHTALEMVWTVVPTIIVLFIFVVGFIPYMDGQVAPGDAMEINVTAKKWLWQFEYPGGIRTLNEIHVPAGRPIRLIMSSEDVIHSFFIPNMRVKQDVLPGRYSTIWFEPEVLGDHTIFCTEYCGRGHSDMVAKLTVHDDQGYQKWLETGGLDENMPLSELGAILYKTRGCETCHSIDGSRRDCPTFKDLYLKQERLASGSTVLVDENYIRESILEPNAKLVAGYQSIMPTFQGLLRERELGALIAFIKTQSSLAPAGGEEPAAAPAATDAPANPAGASAQPPAGTAQ